VIFLAAPDGSVLFVLLGEQDANNMRGGRTAWVDERQLGGRKYGRVVLSLHKNKEAALAYNRAAAEHFREFACLNPV
jgi:hypothetical protein